MAFIALLLIIVLLFSLLAAGLAIAAKERRALQEEHDRLAATLPPTTEATVSDNRTRGYLRLAEGQGTLLFFGDDVIYGRGLGGTLDLKTPGSVTTLSIAALREAYGAQLGAVAISIEKETTPAPPHTLAFLTYFVAEMIEKMGIVPSVVVLAPSDETIRAGVNADPAGYDFATDLEGCIRALRGFAPQCDILLTVPTNAAASTARTIRAVADHYELCTLDLRQALTPADELIHQSGADLGYPTAAGHAAAASVIAEAVGSAVSAEHTSPPLPEERLYPEK